MRLRATSKGLTVSPLVAPSPVLLSMYVQSGTLLWWEVLLVCMRFAFASDVTGVIAA